MQLQVSELVNLTIAIAVLPPMVAVTRRLGHVHASNWPLMAYVAMVTAYVLTILEGIGGTAGEWLNLFEHVAMLASGALFVVATRGIFAASRRAKGGSE